MSHPSTPRSVPHAILPPAMLGVLGGGQLGRMFVSAARTMGYEVTVLDPDPHSPAVQLATRHLCAPYTDPAALAELARSCAAVTTEFENVPAEALAWLGQHVPVAPSERCVAVAQDRIAEKRFLQQAGLAVAPFLALEAGSSLPDDLSPWLPGIVKLARLGYDGKGQIRVSTRDEVQAAREALDGATCVLERCLTLRAELSVIVCRTNASQALTFPVAENRHTHGILDVSIVPARVANQVAQRAREMALQLAHALDYQGVLAVELFVLDQDQLVVNEIAPRPHNSGHYTLDATATSQFEQQVRTLCQLPPGDPQLLSPVVMVNLLGDVWPAGRSPDWSVLLGHPGCHLHLYGKQHARPGRKMGHFNLLAHDVETALHDAHRLKTQLDTHANLEPTA